MGALSALVEGAGCVVRALAFLRRERALWGLCAAPLLTTVVLLVLAAFAFFGWALDPLASWLSTWLDVGPPAAWYGWLWVGPLRALAFGVELILSLAFFALVCVAFVALGGVVASPFLEALSRRVEGIEAGQVIEVEGGWRQAWVAMGQEARRALFLVAGATVLLAVGLVPGGQIPAALGGALWAAFFLPLEYTGFVLDRRGVAFAQRRSWLWAHRWHMLGFSGAATLSFLVPLLNFLCLPLLVTAGTRLALELGPPDPAPAAPGPAGPERPRPDRSLRGARLP